MTIPHDKDSYVRWEYATFEVKTLADLNGRGDDGWELVTINVVPSSISGNHCIAWMKRQRWPDGSAENEG